VVRSAGIAAYLRVRSSAEESGKTTLLEVLDLLLRDRAINAVSVSPSVIYRLRDKVGPVALLLDETDNGLAKRKDDSARDLLAIVNAGYRHTAKAYRSDGKSFEPRAFSAFGPAAIAGIGYLEPTTESRCIPILLPRRKGLERFISFLFEDDANAIADRLEAWATDEVTAFLRTYRPEFPAELRSRHVEVWWNLFGIADMAGGEWPARARKAALALHVGQEDSSALSTGVLLLAHIREAFDDADADRASSSEIIHALVSNEEGPWAKWWAAEVSRAHREGESPRVAAADLARKLKGFERADGTPIKPRVIRMPGDFTSRGYVRSDFEAAWETYLGSPPVTDVTDVTPLASTVTSVTSVTTPHPKPPEVSTNGGELPGAEGSDDLDGIDDLITGQPS